MSRQENIKQFKRALARHGLFTFSWIFNKLPYDLVDWLTNVLTGIAYCFVIRQKKIARESLQIAFGTEKSPEELEDISRRCFKNFGRGMVELIYFANHPIMVKERVAFEGKEHVDQALAKGKGVIIVTAHFGNFPLMFLKCVQNGYKANVILRRTRDPEMEKYAHGLRTKFGLKTIYSYPRTRSVGASIKALKNNGLLFILLDQNFGAEGGVFVDFFGEKAATATGPAIFARRTGASIVPMFMVRQSDQSHKIIAEAPIPLESMEDEKQAVYENTTAFTKKIEEYVRRYPHEWAWMHRRWKSRPKSD